MALRLFTFVTCALLLAACSQPPAHVQTTTAGPCSPTALEGPCAIDDAGVAMNDIQAVGSHNSYKLPIPPAEMALLSLAEPELAQTLDYGHAPLTEQLDLGMRQIELDVYYDPEGGRYADPLLPRRLGFMPGTPRIDTEALRRPGFKVAHVQDVDARSSCTLFTACLAQIRAWSDAHPEHAPILIMLNAKDDKIELDGSVDPLPFDAAAFDALDAEILASFPRAQLITPDDVRGNAATLREGALGGGWPSLAAARGRVFFALDEGAAKVTAYLRGHASLEGLPMFVNSLSEAAPHAAYFTMNEPIADQERIRAAVAAGFIVRTRADADTREARTGDTTRREAAFASGAQYISTDYYYARPDFSDYAVALPGGSPAHCNPVRGCGAPP
ncbi:MAG: phosphatidylinositol-specific phospholipase C1-like protein [Hyphomonadaceae bacterium]|nr:phosphatidylinositol-specific phospholipase C1-like protein [Hyphomonadaceae bacterium]